MKMNKTAVAELENMGFKFEGAVSKCAVFGSAPDVTALIEYADGKVIIFDKGEVTPQESDFEFCFSAIQNTEVA